MDLLISAFDQHGREKSVCFAVVPASTGEVAATTSGSQFISQGLVGGLPHKPELGWAVLFPHFAGDAPPRR